MSAGRAAASSSSSARCSSCGSFTRRAATPKLSASRTKSGFCKREPIVRPPKLRLLVAQHVRERMVVEDDRHERDAVLRSRRELLHAEHEAAVPRDGHDGFAGIRHFGAERRRKAEAECALEALRDIGSRRQDRKRARVRREADLRQLRHEDAVARQHGADRAQERGLRLDAIDRGVGDALRRGDLRGARRGSATTRLRRRSREQSAGRRGVGDDGDVGLEALHLGGIDVDADQLRPVRRLALVAHRIAPAHVRHLEAAADADEHVDVVPQLARRDAGDSERVILGHDAAAAAKRRHGCLQRLGKRSTSRGCVLSARAAHDHGLLRGARAAARRRRWRPSSTAGSGSGASAGSMTAGACARHRVPAHLDGDRPGAAAGRVAKRLVDEPRCVARRVDSPGVLDERSQRRGLIGELVQVSAAAPEKRRRNLARQAHDRRAVAHRRAQRRRGVQDAGSRDDREDSRPARRFRIAHRHVGGRLLVPRHDELDVRAVQRIEQRIDLRARHAEERRHAVGARGLDDGRAARQLSLFKMHQESLITSD